MHVFRINKEKLCIDLTEDLYEDQGRREGTIRRHVLNIVNQWWGSALDQRVVDPNGFLWLVTREVALGDVKSIIHLPTDIWKIRHSNVDHCAAGFRTRSWVEALQLLYYDVLEALLRV
jgi:hypothetical protein